MQRLHRLSRDVDAFVVISREIDDELNDLDVPNEKRTLIPNGVDTEHFLPLHEEQKPQVRAELSLPSHSPLVVYVGRLVAEKRVDYLLRIWPYIRMEIPEARLLIVGTGPEEPRLRGMTIAGVQFAGQANDVVRYLQAADLFVLPSSTEGLSNSLLEAMSTGLPVLATSVGGTPDVIQHGVTGYLIPPDNADMLKHGLRILLEDKVLRTKLGSNARQLILSDFSLDSVSRRLANVYRHLLIRQ